MALRRLNQSLVMKPQSTPMSPLPFAAASAILTVRRRAGWARFTVFVQSPGNGTAAVLIQNLEPGCPAPLTLSP
jgi:hypothetical protein